MIAVWIALGFSILYLLLQIYYLSYWIKTPTALSIPAIAVQEGVTVVIIAHNEEKSITTCLEGILSQQFPAELMEVIVIDDHSTDGTVSLIKNMEDARLHLFLLKEYPDFIHPPAFKKSGITLGVEKASFDTIVVTDADCIHQPNWLKVILYGFIQSNAVFQTGPVILMPGATMMQKMQEVEQLILMLITGAGMTSKLHDLANGANMVFRKLSFQQVNGFVGNEQYASGDDLFLIEKMRNVFPDKISFIKSMDAVVYTKAKKTWASLMQQRLRWAGKNKGLKDKTIHRIWLFVGAFHVVLVLTLLGSIANILSPWSFISLFVIKWFADFLLVSTAATFFQRTAILKYFVALQFLYSYYILRLGLMIIVGKKGDWTRSLQPPTP
ncbi:MAG: glycosyltransferase [Saprospiraceae bacterium]|nr:glycosyltransferase [Saprospiraceae bacterium]